jgi:hypothetical protein
MYGTGSVSIPQPAPHPLRASCLSGSHYTYTAFLTPVIEGGEHKELEPEKCITATAQIFQDREFCKCH